MMAATVTGHSLNTNGRRDSMKQGNLNSIFVQDIINSRGRDSDLGSLYL